MIKPLSDRILVKQHEPEKVAGRFVIPDIAQEKPNLGEVIAAGPGTSKVPMAIKEGDNVLFQKHSGTAIEWEGEEYLLMRSTDVFAVL